MKSENLQKEIEILNKKLSQFNDYEDIIKENKEIKERLS